jgi:hypothetical protein
MSSRRGCSGGTHAIPSGRGRTPAGAPEVSSYAAQAGESLVLIDPLSPPAEIVAMGPAAVLLTCLWHRREAAALSAAGAEVYAPGRSQISRRPGVRGGRDAPRRRRGPCRLLPGECVLWIPSHRALVFAESLYGIDGSPRMPLPEWLPEGATVEDSKASLAPPAGLEPQ